LIQDASRKVLDKFITQQDNIPIGILLGLQFIEEMSFGPAFDFFATEWNGGIVAFAVIVSSLCEITTIR
jgi:hypothetical protein